MTKHSKSNSDGNRSVVPIPYHHFPRDFDQETYQRALMLMEETGNVARAHRTLKAELEAEDKPIPSYDTLWLWAKRHKELIDRVRTDKREEIIAISGEIAIAMAERFLETYGELSPGQMPVAYGIAMDKITAWTKPVGSNPMVAFQVNLRTGDEAKVEKGKDGD